MGIVLVLIYVRLPLFSGFLLMYFKREIVYDTYILNAYQF